MNRTAAITRARNLIRQRATQKNMKPVIFCDLDGHLHIKIGDGGLFIRLTRDPGDESDPDETSPVVSS